MSELYELPDNWEWKKLEEIIRIGCERGFKPTIIDGKVPFIGMTNIDKYTGRDTKYILEDNDKVSKGKTKFQKNAVLLGKITPCTQNNKTTIIPDDIDGGYATTEVYALHCLERIKPLYFNYYIRSKQVNEFLVNSMVGATGRQRVPSEVVKNLDIPLPPLQEQKRIVSKLDTLFEKIDKLIALHQKNMDEADVFMGSVLNDVFGELEKEYEKKQLTEVIDFIGGSQPPKSSFSYEKKDGYIRLIQIRDYKTDNHIVYINKESTKKFCTKDDIMIGRYGPPVFQILRGLEGAYNVALMKAVSKSDNLNREYLYLFLQSPLIQHYIIGLSQRSAGQSGVNKVALEEYEIALPPLTIQQKTVAYLDEIFQKIEKIKSVQKEKMESLVALKASILDQAFRGKL